MQERGVRTWERTALISCVPCRSVGETLGLRSVLSCRRWFYAPIVGTEEVPELLGRERGAEELRGRTLDDLTIVTQAADSASSKVKLSAQIGPPLPAKGVLERGIKGRIAHRFALATDVQNEDLANGKGGKLCPCQSSRISRFACATRSAPKGCQAAHTLSRASARCALRLVQGGHPPEARRFVPVGLPRRPRRRY